MACSSWVPEGEALHHLGLREAAIDLVQTFDLEPAPPGRTEKRDG
jgi:hypothetical protein